MLSPDVRIVDVDGTHWVNLLALARRPATVRRRGSLIVFVDGAHVVRALRGDVAIDPADVPWDGANTPLEPIRRAHDVDRVVVIDDGALPALFHDAQIRLDADQDYVEQILTIMRATRARIGDGIWVEPRALSRFPIPSYDSVQRTFDRLWPDGRTLLLYVIDEDADAVHTSLILGKQRGDVTLLTTHASLGDGVPIGRGWRRQYRDVLAAVKEQHGTAHAAVFLSLATWRRVTEGPRGTFSRELTLRNIIIDPVPAWGLLLIGGSALAALAGSSAGLVGRFLPKAWQARVKSMASPFGALGFDPIELWKAWRSRGQASS